MKKLYLLIATLTVFAKYSSQETVVRQNDIIIGPIELIAGPAANISYERLITNDMGIGINGIFTFGNSDDGDGFQSQISPYYRLYFGAKYASGFFVEAFVPITTSNDGYSTIDYVFNNNNLSQIYRDNYEKNTTIGAGIGFGGKWVARRNIVFEASLGIARRFGDGDHDEVTGKGMLGIGYRF